MIETGTEKQVTKKATHLPSTSLFEADAQIGFENVDQSSVALPILKLLQNGSGEAQKRNASYVEGAEPGMFLNTVTTVSYTHLTLPTIYSVVFIVYSHC